MTGAFKEHKILAIVDRRTGHFPMNKAKSKRSSGLYAERDIVYLKTFGQKKLYRVLDPQTGKTSFVGMKAECKRYIQVLKEKIAQQGNRQRFKPSPIVRLYRLIFPVSRKESE